MLTMIAICRSSMGQATLMQKGISALAISEAISSQDSGKQDCRVLIRKRFRRSVSLISDFVASCGLVAGGFMDL